MAIKRMHPAQVALFAAVLWTALPTIVSGQSSDPCKDPRLQQAWGDRTNPVRADATELTRTLERRGFVVECVRRSKQENLFEGQKGAAWYKTDHGVFEVLFLPKMETFAALEVIERAQGNHRYVYSFLGNPQIPTKMDSAKPISFIKHTNMLIEVWGDKQLAATIQKALQKP